MLFILSEQGHVMCSFYNGSFYSSLTAWQAVAAVAVEPGVAVTAEAGGIVCAACVLTALLLVALTCLFIIG